MALDESAIGGLLQYMTKVQLQELLDNDDQLLAHIKDLQQVPYGSDALYFMQFFIFIIHIINYCYNSKNMFFQILGKTISFLLRYR